MIEAHKGMSDRYELLTGQRGPEAYIKARLFSKVLGKLEGSTLDIGCWIGEKSRMVSGEVTGLDIDERILEVYRRETGNRGYHGTAESLPFENDSFDNTLLIDTLEHLDNDKKALQEANRVLKPGGTLVVSVPLDMGMWSEVDKAVGHRRRYTTFRLMLKLAQAGFTATRTIEFGSTLRPYYKLFKRKMSDSNLRKLKSSRKFLLYRIAFQLLKPFFMLDSIIHQFKPIHVLIIARNVKE